MNTAAFVSRFIGTLTCSNSTFSLIPLKGSRKSIRTITHPAGFPPNGSLYGNSRRCISYSRCNILRSVSFYGRGQNLPHRNGRHNAIFYALFSLEEVVHESLFLLEYLDLCKPVATLCHVQKYAFFQREPMLPNEQAHEVKSAELPPELFH